MLIIVLEYVKGDVPDPEKQASEYRKNLVYYGLGIYRRKIKVNRFGQITEMKSKVGQVVKTLFEKRTFPGHGRCRIIDSQNAF